MPCSLLKKWNSLQLHKDSLKFNTHHDLGIERFHWPVLIKKYNTMKNKTVVSPNYFLFSREKNPDKSDFFAFTLLMRKYKPSRINLFLLKWQFVSTGSFISYWLGSIYKETHYSWVFWPGECYQETTSERFWEILGAYLSKICAFCFIVCFCYSLQKKKESSKQTNTKNFRLFLKSNSALGNNIENTFCSNNLNSSSLMLGFVPNIRLLKRVQNLKVLKTVRFSGTTWCEQQSSDSEVIFTHTVWELFLNYS